MECARCGGQLETYALNGKEACVCPNCGFADTPVDHDDIDWQNPEPWSAAIERFYEKHAELAESDDGAESGEPTDSEVGAESEETTETPDPAESDEAAETTDGSESAESAEPAE